jgi:hypothetical protein
MVMHSRTTKRHATLNIDHWIQKLIALLLRYINGAKFNYPYALTMTFHTNHASLCIYLRGLQARRLGSHVHCQPLHSPCSIVFGYGLSGIEIL